MPDIDETCEVGSPAYFGTGPERHVLSWRERLAPERRARALRRRAGRLLEHAESLEAGVAARLGAEVTEQQG